MGVYGDLIGYESLEIVSPYALQQLSEIKIVRRLNCHTALYYTGIIPETQKDSYIFAATAKDAITVNRKGRSGAVEPLFKGVVVAIGVKAVRGIYYLEVEARSHTAELDVKLRDRSFQNKDLKYTEFLKQILSSYSGGSIKDKASNGGTLTKLIVQKEETDWQLLKRQASRFNTFLVPYDLADQPKLWFGLPDEDDGDAELSDDLPYQVGKNLDDYAELSENYLLELRDTDCTYYVVTTGQYYPLGSMVKFKGANLIVTQSIAELQNGSLLYEYLLCPSDGLKQKPLYNQQITGASLKGKVIDTNKDQVRVHLEIDRNQDKNTAWWFPYASFYTAEGNSGWYCMPQLGDYLQIYFPTCREEEAIATNSVRQDKESCQKTQDPSVKYLGTNHGKELMLAGGELSLTAKNQKEGKIQIKLNDNEGIEIRSDNELYLTARKNLIFDLEQKATIKAKEEVQVVCGDSSLDMDGITHFKGVEVAIDPQK
jgi:hypothetical protein